MDEPCKFPPLDNSQRRFLWAHKEVDLAQHAVADVVLEVEDAEKFFFLFKHLVSKAWILFTETASRCNRFNQSSRNSLKRCFNK